MALNPANAAAVLSDIASRLPGNGYDDPRRDARLLLGLAMGRDDGVMPHEEITLTPDDHKRLEELIARRCQGEPISRMRGVREFYGIDFNLDPSTLDPRADSEVLVDTALDWLNDEGGDDLAMLDLAMLDLGTGSGCLILSLAKNFPKTSGIGIDFQPAAIAVAERNAKMLGLSDRVQFITSDWDDALEEGRMFDLIISNPPYIPTSDLDHLMDEVRRYDPLIALDGGEDGLEQYRRLAPVISRRLKPQGAACIEIGQEQEKDVEIIFTAFGLGLVEARRDLSGVVRCLRFTKM